MRARRRRLTREVLERVSVLAAEMRAAGVGLIYGTFMLSIAAGMQARSVPFQSMRGSLIRTHARAHTHTRTRTHAHGKLAALRTRPHGKWLRRLGRS